MPALRPHSRICPPFLACCLVAAGSGLAANPESPFPALPSIVAEHVRLHVPSDTELARVRVELSSAGLRATESGRDTDLEIVQDFIGERLWFVDRARRVAHAPALLDDGGDGAAGGDTPLVDPDHGSFLGVEPCGSEVPRGAGSGSWRGRTVDVWRCPDTDASIAAIVFVDREHGLVVRRETADGIVDELRDVRPMRFAPGHFVPPARFRRIDERELLRGAPTIGDFREGGTP